MKFRSRISILLVIIIMIIFSTAIIHDATSVSMLLGFGIPFVSILVIFGTINYTILNNDLIIRICWCKMATIDIAKIRIIRRSYNPLSSPAGSMKRLEMKFIYNGKLEMGLISPVRESEFIEKLKAINPDIEIDQSVYKKQSNFNPINWDI